MRSKILSFAILAIAGIAVLSCSKEIRIEGTNESKVAQGITVNVISGEGTTRTIAVDGDIPKIQWVDTDKISLFEVVDGQVKGKAESNPAVISDNKASFSATLDWEAEGSSYQYSAVYPADNVFSYGGVYYILLPDEQFLNGNNFSEDSDILFSTPLDHGSSRVDDGEDILFKFRRLGSVVRLNLVGLGAGEKINSVKITAPVNIAGSIVYDPATSTVDPSSAFEGYGTDTVLLYLDEFEATGNDIVWFRIMAESDWAAGEKFTVEVVTDQNIYVKEVTLPSVLKFPDGGVTRFGVNLASSAVPALTVPYICDFEEGADDWTFLDVDGDGYYWFVQEVEFTGTDFSTALISESYRNNVGAFEPDNWAYSPRVQLTQGNYLSFWVSALDPKWRAEHYAVYITKGSPAGEMTTLIPETEFPGSDYVELKYSGHSLHCIVKIPEEFDNEVVCIAFRHFNCTDMYALVIDDVSITEEYPYQPPQADYYDYLGQWTDGSRTFTIEQKQNGTSYTISGFAGQEYSVEAKFEGNNLVVYDQVVYAQILPGQDDTEICFQGLYPIGNTLYFDGYPDIESSVLFIATYDAEQNSLIVQSPKYTNYIWISYLGQEPGEFGTYASIPDLLTPYVHDDSYLFKDGFEDGFNGWTLLDADQDEVNWQILNASDYANTGDCCLWGYSYNNGASYDPDNYAFTPAITLTSNNYVSFWVSGWVAAYPDHYGIFISESAPTYDNLEECEMLYEDIADNLEYEKVEFPIPSKYDGKTVYIAIRHFDSYDNYYLFIDDFAVTVGQRSTPSSSAVPVPKYVNSKGKYRMRTVKVDRPSGRSETPVQPLPVVTRR